MKYRKKPVEVEAVQFFRKNIHELKDKFPSMPLIISHEHFFLNTQQIFNGDWVVKGSSGEYYLCKPDIFEKTYEKVEEWEQTTQQYLNETGKDRL